MKKIFLLILMSLSTYCVQSQELKIDKNQNNSAGIDKRIVEVFGNQLENLVLNDTQRLSDLTDILDNRTEIIEQKNTSNEKYLKLSSVPLFNKYNQNLERDKIFNKNNFNVLKYDLEFYAKSVKVYRIDNTNYLLVIQPQNLKR